MCQHVVLGQGEMSGASLSAIPRSQRPQAQSERGVSQGLLDVRKAAKVSKLEQFTALLHHLTANLLQAGLYALKRRAAPGVDGVRCQEYGIGLEGRIHDLHSRIHRGAYRAKPSRRIYIPKPDGRQRPIGIAALEKQNRSASRCDHSQMRFTMWIFGDSAPGFGRTQPASNARRLIVGIQRKRVNCDWRHP